MGKVGFGRWRVAKVERRLEEEGEEGTRRDDSEGRGEKPGTVPFPWVGGSGDGGDSAGKDGVVARAAAVESRGLRRRGGPADPVGRGAPAVPAGRRGGTTGGGRGGRGRKGAPAVRAGRG